MGDRWGRVVLSLSEFGATAGKGAEERPFAFKVKRVEFRGERRVVKEGGVEERVHLALGDTNDKYCSIVNR